MIIPGLVSVSFRQLQAYEILQLCKKANLHAVEWGGDIHVPAGDTKKAAEVSKMSKYENIQIASYGSYYRLGQPIENFIRCLDTACTLGAPSIRIWAGSKNSIDYCDEERKVIVEQLIQIDELATRQDVVVAPEFHSNTLTDSLSSLEVLLIEAPKIKFYWQPRWDWPEDHRLEALNMIGDRIKNIHVFSWKHENGKEVRLPLSAGENMWKKVIAQLKIKCYALLEFVENDSEEALLRDSHVLLGWINEKENMNRSKPGNSHS